ncbi:putative signal peptidase complex subunit 2 [Apostasia shenzhenica]|uniref:Signal peptidase complex subunit 2 n=1 Tax=Apostasia shenzhenica TaxID=1088818 RepID=A0A2I0AKT4_9ASPA|nr:putative signal peptidase complex subunit 2 [Apostasia shenzhenica]
MKGIDSEFGIHAGSAKNPNKEANLLDPHSIKHILDESIHEIVTSRGFPEDFRLSNFLQPSLYWKLGKHWITSCFLLFFFDYGNFVVLNVILLLISFTKEKNALLFTYPPPVSFCFSH